MVWRDLKAIVAKSPTSSALVREINPEVGLWGLQEQLLAEIVDTQHLLWWAKTKGAQAKPPQGMPDRIPRPGVKPNSETIRFDVLPTDEMLDWLGWEMEVSDGGN